MKRGWRVCRRCKVAKPVDQYPIARARSDRKDPRPRRSVTCQECHDKQYWRVKGRRCSRCGETRNFPDEIGWAHNSVCVFCRREKWRERGRRDRARKPERYREYVRDWQAKNPEKYKESLRRYLERVKTDPVLRARYLEHRRIAERLRREQRGGKRVEVEEHKTSGNGPEIPLEPLKRVVLKIIEQRRLDDDDIRYHLGIDARSVRRWEDEDEDVRVTRAETVDRVCGHLGLNWWDIYEKPANGHKSGRPEDVLRYIDEADVYVQACLAFEGELVE